MEEPLEIDVQVSTVGTLQGSDALGQPVEENITEESLGRLADKLNAEGREILVDVDHKSVAAGTDRDTRAAGWLSRFWATAKGLFGRLTLTPHGRKLVEGKEYRSLSPVFTLDEKNEPIEMHSVALTNQPAMDMQPILNTSPQEEIEMTKDEIIALIKETVAAMKVEEEKMEAKADVEKAKVEAAAVEEAVNQCGKKPAMNEEAEKPVEEPVEKPVEKPACEKPGCEKEEVVKVEALNSMPAPTLGKDEGWRSLNGKAFWDYLTKHPECR